MEERNKEWEKFWVTLPERERMDRLIEQYHGIKEKVADNQVRYLDEFNKNATLDEDSEKYWYLFNIVESFWRDGDFMLHLGEGEYKIYAIYPVRTMMEKMLKIIWLSKQSIVDQSLITSKEFLSSCLQYYKMDQEAGKSGEEWRESYKKNNRKNIFPEIDSVKKSDLKTFPTYEEMCIKSEIAGAERLYSAYRYLSDLPHGGLLVTYMSWKEEQRQHIRHLMFAIRFCLEMINVVDNFLDGKTTEEVRIARIYVNQIRLKGMSGLS